MATLINADDPRTKQREVVEQVTLAIGTPGDQYIAVDPRKVTSVEIHADGQNFSLSTSTIANSTNDLEDSSQLWIAKVTNTTTDFQSGTRGDVNFIGIKIHDLGTLTSELTYQVAQIPINDEKN